MTQDLRGQEDMERVFSGYFANMQNKGAGSFGAMLNTRLAHCDYKSRSIILRMELKDWMANPYGILHGGISAAVLDMAMGILCGYFSGGVMTPTVSMEVNYVKPGVIGGQLMIQADLTGCGATLCHAAAKAWMEDTPDRTVCTAAGVYYISRRPGGVK